LLLSRQPSLLVISAPKSGTVYLNTVFQRSLGLRNVGLCNGYYPRDYVSIDRLHRFATDGNQVASSHLDPNPTNLHMLTTLLPRWVVHVRDPRACLLSWVHHVRRLQKEGRHMDLLRVTPTPPASVLNGTLTDCIDWHIDRFYRPLIAWIEAWVEVASASPNRVMLTEYAALHDDEEALCREIAAFVGYPPSSYRHRAAARTMATHFRSGELHEWQHVFTRDQIRRTTAMLRPELCQRFDWPHDIAPAAVPARARQAPADMEAAEPGD
jgi:hypothetical protein